MHHRVSLHTLDDLEHCRQQRPAQEVARGGEVGDGGVVRVRGPGPHAVDQHRGQVQQERHLGQGRVGDES